MTILEAYNFYTYTGVGNLKLQCEQHQRKSLGIVALSRPRSSNGHSIHQDLSLPGCAMCAEFVDISVLLKGPPVSRF